MKAKFALDKATMQQFFLQHSEKILFGLVVFGLLFFVYSAVARPTYTKAPQELITDAERAARNVENTPDKVDLKVVDYGKKADLSRKMVDPDLYQQELSWIPPVFKSRGKRGEPKTYPVQKLAASPGFGAVAAKGGGESTRGFRWVMITGLVPLAQQTKEYVETFRDAFPRGPEINGPAYEYYEVQRAEVKEGGDRNPEWTPLDLDKAFQTPKQWNGVGQEVVDKRFLNEALTYPLAPLAIGQWGENAAHPPEIPLGDAGAATSGTAAAPASVAAAEPENEAGVRTRRPVAAAPKPETPAAVAVGTPAKSDELKYLLFRFTDFTVEPGKQYRYRVQLVLKNPNHGIDARYLLDAAMGKKEFLETKWSESTEAVFIPRDDRVLVKMVVNKAIRVESTAVLELLKWMADKGQQYHAEVKTVLRGQSLNLLNYPAIVIAGNAGAAPADPAAPDGGLLGAAGVVKPPKGVKGGQPEGPRANFESGMILVDMRGGDRQPGKDRIATEPGEVLLLDIDGTLVVRDELTDAEILKALLDVKANPAAGGGQAPPAGKADAAPAAGGDLLNAAAKPGRKPARKPAGG